ncbi:hypothetical protein IMSHALPRED_002993 [Imshaugia aleurites]|uniref:NAD(P)-binding domain-containing protein n=1 Tax=Imshaugia aleurites TaxID=172621 RepID=A0A8H3F5S1_9LECA|nr:hypothetical protein IMSHALPRED_002993 [Imshaugia aleurites]
MATHSKTVAFLGASTGVDSHHSSTHSQQATGASPSAVVQGNAHDIAAVSKCLVAEKGKLVDAIVSTIGGKFIFSRMTIDDKEVCRKGMTTILETLAQLRSGGATGKPHIIDPHKDKQIMEDRLVESGETYTIIRASLLVNGETSKKIRVGIEDPKTGRESEAIGYTISREDTGKWVADNLVLQLDGKYVNKIVMVTY